jgi:GTP cyclohydrolase IA
MEVRRDLRVQLEAATLAAQALLEALGVDLTRAGMAATPARMARAYMLPCTGIAHVGYLPGDRILGLSKLARLFDLTGVART